MAIIEANPEKIIIIDEAYADFCNCSMANYVSKYPNLLIVKTLSKAYSLAGARCGYAIGDATLINGLKTVKDSFNCYNVNYLTETIAIKALQDTEYVNSCIDKLSQREIWLPTSCADWVLKFCNQMQISYLQNIRSAPQANFIISSRPTGCW